MHRLVAFFLALALFPLSALGQPPEAALSNVAPSPNPSLAQARGLYQSLNYAGCMEKLEKARKEKPTRPEQADIELYAGMCSYGLNQEEEAAQHFALARELNPDLTLPKHSSPKIRALFDKVEPAYRPPPPAFVMAPKEPDPRAVQRREQHRKWEWIFLGVAAGATGLGAAMGVRAQAFESASYSPALTFESDVRAVGQDAQRYAAAANASYTVAVSAVVIAAVLKLSEISP